MISRIYIPTLGRHNNQITWDNMPSFVRDITVLVVQPHEQHLHGDKPILVLPEDDYGITKTRRWIYDHAGDILYGVFDDDLKFVDRNPGHGIEMSKEEADESWATKGEHGKQSMTEEDWRFFLNKTSEWLNGDFAFAGSRLGNMSPYKWHDGYYDNTSIFCVYFFNGKKLPPSSDLDWSLDLAEDAHLVLQLLEKGYSNRCWDKFVVLSDQFMAGGCNSFRTIHDTNCSHEQLIKKHPKYVKWSKHGKDDKKKNIKKGDIKTKKIDGIEMKKVRVSWGQAYKDSQK